MGFSSCESGRAKGSRARPPGIVPSDVRRSNPHATETAGRRLEIELSQRCGSQKLRSDEPVPDSVARRIGRPCGRSGY